MWVDFAVTRECNKFLDFILVHLVIYTEKCRTKQTKSNADPQKKSLDISCPYIYYLIHV